LLGCHCKPQFHIGNPWIAKICFPAFWQKAPRLKSSLLDLDHVQFFEHLKTVATRYQQNHVALVQDTAAPVLLLIRVEIDPQLSLPDKKRLLCVKDFAADLLMCMPPTYQYPTRKERNDVWEEVPRLNWPMSRALSPPALSEPAAFEELPRGDIPTPQEATAIFRFLTRANRTPAPSL
jgi:hypothetical protein